MHVIKSIIALLPTTFLGIVMLYLLMTVETFQSKTPYRLLMIGVILSITSSFYLTISSIIESYGYKK